MLMIMECIHLVYKICPLTEYIIIPRQTSIKIETKCKEMVSLIIVCRGINVGLSSLSHNNLTDVRG